MGREDWLDAQATEQIEHLAQRHATRLQRCNRILNATGLRPTTVLQEVLTPPADTMHLLSQVDRLKPTGESANQVAS
jgi:hypothetical protein